MGPMSEVVGNGTQHLDAADLDAMAEYLQALPPPAEEPPPAAVAVPTARGSALYKDHCAGCHGERGEGVADAYPALAGSRAVTMRSPANLVHIVLEGGYPPSTHGNPRPFGMPPFATVLQDADVAEVLNHLRASWGNQGAPVSTLDVARARGGNPR
jgi:mono/diheme cytochrome c family protein